MNNTTPPMIPLQFFFKAVGCLIVLVVAVTATADPVLGWQIRRNTRVNLSGEISAAKVRKAVDGGVRYLKDRRNRKGEWPDKDSKNDVTALATLALLNAGESPNNSGMKKSLDALVERLPSTRLSVYAASLKIMALVTADPSGKRYRREIKNTVDWLLDQQMPSGGWRYHPSRGQGDSSNSQFAILALHEAASVGVVVDDSVWKKARDYWQKCYRPGGGFSYSVGGGGTDSMSYAGVSSSIIIDENLADLGRLIDGDRANCCLENRRLEPVEVTLNMLGRRFSLYGRTGVDYYFLYGMERAGRLSGRRFIGVHDWYRAGANVIIKNQKPLGGFWDSVYDFGRNQDKSISTSLALLFLAKGKRPVAIGKYQYGEPEDRTWDAHPKGVHYLTREMEKQWATKLNWQIVKSSQATVDDLLESPVLFISGSDQMDLSDLQKENLRKYIEAGGFIFAEACDGEGCRHGKAFDRSFRNLMAELFPENELQALPADHPVWTAQNKVVPNAERPLLGLQACCRTSVIYCPKNLSAYWNLNRPALDRYLNRTPNPGLEKRVRYCSDLGVNVVTYATGRELREKGETPKYEQASTTSVLVNRALTIPKLNHNGGSDEAPSALKNILKLLEASGLTVSTEKKLIEPLPEQLSNYPVIFMHGRSGFQFNEAQRAAIGAHLEAGGFIFADSICTSSEFYQSFAKEIAQITGKRLQPIPTDHPMWTDQFDGHAINRQRVTLRLKDPSGQEQFKSTPTMPIFEGIEIDGRYVVALSKYDISCALENTSPSQCEGYTRESASRIGFNVILYAQQVD